MNFRVVLFVLSLIGSIVSGSMFLPAAWAWFDGTPDANVLFRCAFFSLAACVALALSTRPSRRSAPEHSDIGAREAFAIVSFSWVVASVIGALPYVLYGTTSNFTDAFFETMSGFTTTGASILTDIEENPRGILLWRALTHWLGGMGIIVLSLTILPFIGGGGMQLFKAESPGPLPEKLTPRLQQTAAILWEIYIFLTVLEIGALMLCGTSFYEGVTHAFATIATGGFSIYNDSIAHFHSPAVEWVVTAFTFLSGVNFSLHYLFLRGSFSVYLKDDEFRWYTRIILIAAAAVTCSALWSGMDLPFSQTLRHAAFQTVTLITTTGFMVTDTLQWPHFAQMALLAVMFVGGCAGSTSGGVKVVRFMIAARHAKNDMIRTLQPHRVLCVRINGKPQESRLISSVLSFFVYYIAILTAVSLFLAALGIDLLSSFSGALTCISNVGPGLGAFGPVSNYAAVPAAGKWVLAFAMLIGRLELTTVLLLFVPDTWRR